MQSHPSPAGRIASRTLQIAVAGLVLAGAARPGAMWTAPMYGVAILAIPPVLGRLCRYRLDPLQRAWFSFGLAVHPLGVLYSFYGRVLWYDHLAHAASASLVAGVLYLAVTSTRSDSGPHALDRTLHAVVLAGVLLAGVGWEMLELHVAYLQVYGMEDTVADVSYDVVGWLAVAPRWRAFLRALPSGLAGQPRADSTPALPPGDGEAVR